jgi:hypothetical protein
VSCDPSRMRSSGAAACVAAVSKDAHPPSVRSPLTRQPPRAARMVLGRRRANGAQLFIAFMAFPAFVVDLA